MSQSDPHRPHTERFVFGRYALDPARRHLRVDGRERPLRPEAFAVLRHLLEHPGEVVAPGALLEAGWPGLLVTDETLTRTIAELRHAMGDAGEQLIITEPAGYRLNVAAVPPERRGARRHVWRWRWLYGLLAPFIVAMAFVVIWWVTRARG